MELFLLLWLFCGFMSGVMAEARGRNFIIGSLAGFFFGFFAILYYLIAGDTSKKRAEAIRDALRKGK